MEIYIEKEDFQYKIKKKNSIIIALFIMQQGLILPIMATINPQILVAIFSFILIFVELGINGKSINLNYKTICLLLTPIILILLKCFFQLELRPELTVLCNYFAVGLSAIVMGMFPFDQTTFIKWGFYIGTCSYAFLAIYPALPLYGDDYMRYGYALLPITIFSFAVIYMRIENVSRLIASIVFLCASLEMIVFGARGCMLSLFLFVFCCFFFGNKGRKGLKLITLFTIGALALLSRKIILASKEILDMLGVSSYAMEKFVMIAEQGFAAASSGRDTIYEGAIKSILENPVFGTSFAGAEKYANIEYYHNVFLQIAADFGLIVLIIFFAFLLSAGIRIYKNYNTASKVVMFIVFSISFGRLMFSSTYWQRPEFWLCLSIYCSDFLSEEAKCVRQKRDAIRSRAVLENHE